MSLINDALKRANADHKPRPQSAPVPEMHPVELPAKSASLLPWAVLLLGVGVLGIAAALWFRGRPQPQVAQNTDTSETAGGPVTPAAPVQAPAQAPALAPTQATVTSAPDPILKVETPPQHTASVAASAPAEPVAIKAVPANQPVVTTTPHAEPTPVTVAAAATTSDSKTAPSDPPVSVNTQLEPSAPAAEPAKPRPPRLGAIYYRLRNPTVVLNGKTVGPGQSVDGIRVVSIQRTSVEVVQDGKYRTLTLQD